MVKIFVHFLIYSEALPHIWLCNRSRLELLTYEENFIFFFISVYTSDLNNGISSYLSRMACPLIAASPTIHVLPPPLPPVTFLQLSWAKRRKWPVLYGLWPHHSWGHLVWRSGHRFSSKLELKGGLNSGPNFASIPEWKKSSWNQNALLSAKEGTYCTVFLLRLPN